MIVILILSNLLSLALVFYLFYDNKKKKAQLSLLQQTLIEKETIFNTISEEKSVLELELEFLKSIYRSKLLNASNKQMELTKTH